MGGRQPKAISARPALGVECPAPHTGISRLAMKGEEPTVTCKGKLSQFYHVAIAADKVQGHRNYDVMRGIAGAFSVAPRTFSMRRDELDFVVFCFAKSADAEAFCEHFGGDRLVPHLRSPRRMKMPSGAMSGGVSNDNAAALNPSVSGVKTDPRRGSDRTQRGRPRVADKRLLMEEERRALELLAGNPRGATEEALVLGHGFKLQMLIGLVRGKLAKRCRVTVKAAARTIGVSYMMITAAGRKAVGALQSG